jgi:membrane protease YdiL (CAAX protease family)
MQPRIAVSLLAIAVIAVGSVAWVRAIRRLAAGEPILPQEPRRQVPWGLFDLVLLIAANFAAMLVVGTLAGAIGLRVSSEITKETARDMLLMQVAMQFLGSLPVVAFIALRTDCNWRDLGIVWQKVGRDLQLGAIAFAMLAPPVYAIQALLTNLVQYEHTLIDIMQQDPRLLWLGALSAAVAAPVCEELQFRLLLQGWLEKVAVWSGDTLPLLMGGRPPHALRLQEAAESDKVVDAILPDEEPEMQLPPEDEGDATNPYKTPRHPVAEPVKESLASSGDLGPKGPALVNHWPTAVSALLFAGMHLGQGPAPVPLFVLALGLGYLYERTHRILPSITVHLLLNATTMVILTVEIYFPAAPAT